MRSFLNLLLSYIMIFIRIVDNVPLSYFPDQSLTSNFMVRFLAQPIPSNSVLFLPFRCHRLSHKRPRHQEPDDPETVESLYVRVNLCQSSVCDNTTLSRVSMSVLESYNMQEGSHVITITTSTSIIP